MGLVLDHLRRAGSNLAFLQEGVEATIGQVEIKGHPLRNEAIRLTKRCIAQVKRGDRSLVPLVRTRIPEILVQLREEKIWPSWQADEFVETTNAEFVECLYFDAYYSHFFAGTIDVLWEKLTPAALGVSDQAFYNGLADLVGELAKAVLDWLAQKKPSLEEEIFLLERFLAIAQDIVTFLSQVEGVPEKYLALTGRDEYSSSFYNRLIGAKRYVVDCRRDLQRLKQGQRIERLLGKFGKSSEASG